MKDIVFWMRRFFMLYGIIMICTFFMCLFFNPTSELPVVSFFGRIIVFAILGMVTDSLLKVVDGPFSWRPART